MTRFVYDDVSEFQGRKNERETKNGWEKEWKESEKKREREKRILDVF